MAQVPTAEAPVRIGSAKRRAFRFEGWWGAALLLLLVACPLWQMHVHNRSMRPSHSDLIIRWVGTRAALDGFDPYSNQVLQEIQRAYYGHYPLTAADPDAARQAFLYPAHVVLLLAPLAYLHWETARWVFLSVTLPLLIVGLQCCMQMFPRRHTRLQTGIILVLAICNWPILWGLRLQQPTLLIAAFIFVACFALTRGWTSAAGALLALATVKPQIVFLLLLWLFLWSIVRRLWSFLISFGVTLAILLLWTERLVPHWVSHWRASLSGYGRVTDTAPPLENLFGHWVGLALTALVAASLCLSLWRLRRAGPRSAEFSVAIGLVLVLTVLVIPTHLTMIYNLVLLFPACLFLAYVTPPDRDSRIARRGALALLVLTFALTPMAVLAEAVLKPSIVWGAMPFFSNSLTAAGIAMAAAIIAGRALKPLPAKASDPAPFRHLLMPASALRE
ncbi:MAG TPA: glycosyltransferase family 87 protein [Acidobacteriaceae bacterium]|nr:glycosyltransferase family 87 protein [Acidobacteriaceae bacterium]